jgi:hypothetical protein
MFFHNKGEIMLRAALAFFVFALFAYVLGAYQVAGLSMEIARVLLGIFMFVAIALVIAALFIGSKFKKL